MTESRLALVVLVSQLAIAPTVAHAATVTGRVVLGGTVAGAVVYLEGEQEAPPAASPPHAVMDQRNLLFQPAVLAIVRGTVVQFRNSDDVPHNVFSPSRPGAFDLGRYSRGDARTVTFTDPGEVLVLCNIHMEMEATILVLRDPYFSTADENGGYRVRDVPAGRYRVKIWRRRWLPETRIVDVPDAEAITLDVQPTP